MEGGRSVEGARRLRQPARRNGPGGDDSRRIAVPARPRGRATTGLPGTSGVELSRRGSRRRSRRPALGCDRTGLPRAVRIGASLAVPHPVRGAYLRTVGTAVRRGSDGQTTPNRSRTDLSRHVTDGKPAASVDRRHRRKPRRSPDVHPRLGSGIALRLAEEDAANQPGQTLRRRHASSP